MAEYKLLKGGVLLDGTGPATKENMDVLIKGKYIEEIGPNGTVRYPEGTEVIDCTGHVIMPGLIDAHLHLFGRQVMSHVVHICEDPILHGMRASLPRVKW